MIRPPHATCWNANALYFGMLNSYDVAPACQEQEGGQKKNRKDKIVQRWQTQRHDWKSLGQCRMQAFIWWIRKVADELRVNYLQVQGWIDRNVGAGKQQLPSPLFFLPFLPFPPFSFFLLLKFIRLLTEQLAFSAFGILLALQAASILDLQI